MAIRLVVLNHIAGSKVIVMFPKNPWSRDQGYIEAKQDLRYPGFSFIEIVKNGRVLYVPELVTDRKAPERIMQIVRNIIAGRHPMDTTIIKKD